MWGPLSIREESVVAVMEDRYDPKEYVRMLLNHLVPFGAQHPDANLFFSRIMHRSTYHDEQNRGFPSTGLTWWSGRASHRTLNPIENL